MPDSPAPRTRWTLQDVQALYHKPLLDLVFEAQTVHRQHHAANAVQRCTLLSIKTGGCAEDCGYCSQSVHFDTHVEPGRLLQTDVVLQAAEAAKAQGASRFCMGAAWRNPKDGKQFDQVLAMVQGVSKLGIEVCATLGMLTSEQAKRLKDAGLTAYNHNLDTSEQHYGKIVTTRTYADRLQTIRHVQDAGIAVCCGGILGLGETAEDRCQFLLTLANLDPQPESVPVNQLVAVDGTPLADARPIEPLELVRTIATARILMPHSRVRLSAGRLQMSDEAQALCFLAGANSIFFGDALLTTANPEVERDEALLERLGLHAC